MKKKKVKKESIGTHRSKDSRASRPVVDPGKIPERTRKVLTAYPVRTRSPELRWYSKKDGTVTIKIKKNFGRIVGKLKKVVGGPDFLRIPLDGPGSMIWRNCDGKHNIIEICELVHAEYKEEVEPVLPRIIKFIEHLLKRNMVSLKKADEIDTKGKSS